MGEAGGVELNREPESIKIREVGGGGGLSGDGAGGREKVEAWRGTVTLEAKRATQQGCGSLEGEGERGRCCRGGQG